MDANTDTAMRELTMTRTFDAPRALVFKAWTQPEHLARWMGCEHTVKINVTCDLKVGGDLRVEMTLDDGTLHVVIGKYLEIDAPERLSFTWDWENGGLGTETVVSIDLEEAGGKTLMTMSHRLFDATELRDLHGEGWTASMDRLAEYLPQALGK
jgi:uncharacterized protein YndB with AHSA1/START domain